MLSSTSCKNESRLYGTFIRFVYRAAFKILLNVYFMTVYLMQLVMSLDDVCILSLRCI